MDRIEAASAIEAILFASGDPMPAERIALVLGLEKAEVLSIAAELADGYSYDRRGIRLVRMEDKLQLCSAPEFCGEISRALEQRRPPRLSNAAMEVLAVAAYFQPVTRAYIEQVRGVDSSYTVSTLLERGLIESCGKLDAPGRPELFRTTDMFLRVMGVSTLDELPRLPELGAPDGMEKLESAIESLSEKQLSIEPTDRLKG